MVATSIELRSKVVIVGNRNTQGVRKAVNRQSFSTQIPTSTLSYTAPRVGSRSNVFSTLIFNARSILPPTSAANGVRDSTSHIVDKYGRFGKTWKE